MLGRLEGQCAVPTQNAGLQAKMHHDIMSTFKVGFTSTCTCLHNAVFHAKWRTVKNLNSLLIQVLCKLMGTITNVMVPISLQSFFNKLSFQYAVFYTCVPMEKTVCSHRIQLPDVPFSKKSCFQEVMVADLVNTDWKVMGSNQEFPLQVFSCAPLDLKI